jgi:hypothetical protein
MLVSIHFIQLSIHPLLIIVHLCICRKAGETGVVTFQKLNAGSYKFTDEVLIALLNASLLGELPEAYTLVLKSKEHHVSRLKWLQEQRSSQ